MHSALHQSNKKMLSNLIIVYYEFKILYYGKVIKS